MLLFRKLDQRTDFTQVSFIIEVFNSRVHYNEIQHILWIIHE